MAVLNETVGEHCNTLKPAFKIKPTMISESEANSLFKTHK